MFVNLNMPETLHLLLAQVKATQNFQLDEGMLQLIRPEKKEGWNCFWISNKERQLQLHSYS